MADAELSVARHPAPTSVDPAPTSVDPAQTSADPAQTSVDPAPTSVDPAQPSGLSCDVCVDHFANGRDLERHLRLVHNQHRPFICHLCNLPFSTPSQLEDHVDADHLTMKTFSCEIDNCCTVHSSIVDIEKHVSIRHLNRSGYVKCGICAMSFVTVMELEEHVKSVVCPVDCQGKWKQFGTMPSLPEASIDILDPNLCEKELGALNLPDITSLPGLSLKTTGSRTSHTTTTGEASETTTEALITSRVKKRNWCSTQSHVCNICNLKFKDLDSFTKHYRKHNLIEQDISTSKKKTSGSYMCNICDRSFESFHGLFIHKRIHTGETPYSCNHCESAFVELSGLRTHITTMHPSALRTTRLIKCDVVTSNVIGKQTVNSMRSCQGRLQTIKSLIEHILIVHGGNGGPCGCEVCYKHFSSIDEMRDHIASGVCMISVYSGDSDLSASTGHFEIRTSSREPVQASYPAPSGVINAKKCNICLEVFTDPAAFTAHYRGHASRYKRQKKRLSPSSKVPHECHICGRSFDRILYLHNHVRIHNLNGSGTDTKKKASKSKRAVKPVPELKLGLKQISELNTEAESVLHVKNGVIPVSELKHAVKPVSSSSNVSETNAAFETQSIMNNSMDNTRGPNKKQEVLKDVNDLKSSSAPVKCLVNHKCNSNPGNPYLCVCLTPLGNTSENSTISNQKPDTVSKLQSKDAGEVSPKQLNPKKLVWAKTTNTPAETGNSTNSSSARRLNFQKTCSICSLVFSSMNEFVEHYRSHATGDFKIFSQADKKFTCDQCGNAYQSRQMYLNHLKIHTGETPYVCKLCQGGFRTEKDLRLHIAAVHLKTKFFRITEFMTTTNGRRIFTIASLSELRLHINTSANGANWCGLCESCSKPLRSFSEMQTHILSQKCAVTFLPSLIGESEKFICKICANIYDTVPALSAHMEKVHVLKKM